MFDFLRGGQLRECQEFLNQIHSNDKYLALIGNMPFFDNCNFSQQTESQDLFLGDRSVERQSNISQIEKMLGEDSVRQNSTLGNRNNLIFVDSCLEELNQIQTQIQTHEIKSTLELKIKLVWSAILALQSG